MITSEFRDNIVKLNFSLKTGENESGIVFISDYANGITSKTPQELFALETAKDLLADAVYFRYFNDGREATPQIYIYDNTSEKLKGKEAEIHIKIWSTCNIPIFILVEKSQIKIYDARDKVKIQGENVFTEPMEIIKLAGDVALKFSAKDFDSGLFWEEEERKAKFQFSTSAYKDLIDGLKKVFEDFQNVSGLNSHVALKLLVQCLLIKYLEERDEESKNGYFAKTFFTNHFASSDFCQVIRSGKLLDLLDKLSQTFNGKIFEWSYEFEKSERAAIKNAKVKKLADYLDGDNKNNQYVLWRLYSFSYLPIELISSVYEELLGKGKKDTVYTPDVIASTLIDECMPLKYPQLNFKLIDISCGSGIFLVKAYKRIIQWWRYEMWKNTGILEKPDLTTLKKLLIENVYGIDIQSDAVRLATFSLALAMLDELDPKTIWTKLRFEDLNSKNILESDFFEFKSKSNFNEFSLVIGNPPFNPPNGLSNGKYYTNLKKQFGYYSDIKIPDHNIALLFLNEGIKLLKNKGVLCLIQPSAPLFYQDDNTFLKEFFSKYNLLQVLDFTKLSDVLWGNANIATVAVFVENNIPDEKDIVHITLQDNVSNTKKIFLEIDQQDFHYVEKSKLINDSFIWKINLIGGGRIASLIDRLSKIRTLDRYINEKKGSGWVAGEGFIEGTKGKLADFITNKNYIPTESFTETGINWSEVSPCTIVKIQVPRTKNKKIYSPPHILIKENIGEYRLLVEYTEKYVVFRAKIIGIHSPKKDKDLLLKLYEYIKKYNDLLRFYIICTSSQLLVNRATAFLKEDLMRVPYPSKMNDIKISKAETVLIDDVLKYRFNNTNKLLLKNESSRQDLNAYATIFMETLNSVYKNGKTEFKLFKIIDAGKYFVLHFEYTRKKYEVTYQDNVNLEKYLNSLIPSNSKNTSILHIQKTLKFYSQDTIVLAKPKSLKYWLQSLALRDADECFSDYVKAGF